MIIIALAARSRRDRRSAHAAEIVDVTSDGEKCTTYADCMAIIEAGGDIDYDGISGPLDFNGNGEPLVGLVRRARVRRRQPHRRRADDVHRPPRPPESAIVDLVPVDVERDGDGVLKIGTLLPETGNLAFLGPPEFAGVELRRRRDQRGRRRARRPVEYSARATRATPRPTPPRSPSTRLLGENVDAIIGAASSGVTLTVIDTITSAGVTQFSPANTARQLSDYDDKGLYFRNAPPDILQGAVVADLVARGRQRLGRTSSTSTTPTATASPRSSPTCSPTPVSRCSAQIIYDPTAASVRRRGRRDRRPPTPTPSS